MLFTSQVCGGRRGMEPRVLPGGPYAEDAKDETGEERSGRDLLQKRTKETENEKPEHFTAESAKTERSIWHGNRTVNHAKNKQGKVRQGIGTKTSNAQHRTLNTERGETAVVGGLSALRDGAGGGTGRFEDEDEDEDGRKETEWKHADGRGGADCPRPAECNSAIQQNIILRYAAEQGAKTASVMPWMIFLLAGQTVARMPPRVARAASPSPATK